ncbi:MAG: T9SS type A sorting domain-containing protein [Bacteroidetes bacterium]|nr:T9SS type A sorting domain-containing protein [Bacteroidota bacterium]
MVNLVPRTSMAQCNCSPGNPATPIDYSVTIPATSASSTTVSFPKFNPAVGNLACLTVKDTVSATTTTNAQNKAPDSTVYKFQLTVSDNLSGPGINISNTFNNTYGPDTLAPFNTPGDTKTYGPDVIYSDLPGSASKTAPSASYLGSSGTIDFTYTLSGGVVSTQGGLNYVAGPTTTYSGTFHLTYYWCPSAPLATGIDDFTASPDGSTVLLTWTTPDQQPNTQYEIQVSTDGSNFYSIGKTENNPAPASPASKHQYQYNPDPAYVGKLYFRIQQTDASGKVSFSTILLIDPSGGSDNLISYRAFPNPATNNLIFQFNRNQTGRFLVELVNTAGMVVQQRAVALAGTSQIRLDLNPQPVKGLYFLRTTDLSHGQKYVSKVFIE